MENKVVNFVGLNKVVLGIKWMNGMVKRRLSGGWTEIQKKCVIIKKLVFIKYIFGLNMFLVPDKYTFFVFGP